MSGIDQRRLRVLTMLVALAAWGCGAGKLAGALHPNRRPTIELSQAPVPGGVLNSFAYEIRWTAKDIDGRIDHYQFSVDPPGSAHAETLWTSTTENRHVFEFSADSVEGGESAQGRRLHVVVVVAVDNESARSAPAYRAFTATTVAPDVKISSPSPAVSALFRLGPSVHIEWLGSDSDGPDKLPIGYRFTLLTSSSVIPPDLAVANPDTLRKVFAPAFAGWDSVGGAVRSFDLHDLTPGNTYAFVIVAFDNAGAYSPVFSSTTNILRFRVDAAAQLGPTITFSTPFSVEICYPGAWTDPRYILHHEFLSGMPTPLSWSGKADPGSFVQGYRWALDLASLSDETPRTDESSDLRHWSQWSGATSISLPAFTINAPATSENHVFYMEAKDNNGLLTLVNMQFVVVRITHDRDLLIVNDTWMTPDKLLASGCIDRPRFAWPTASELDSFLCAVGGVPWRCYPTGTKSTPGLFAAYSRDTIHVRPWSSGRVSLSLLAHYRNIIWIVDGPSVIGSAIQSAPVSQLQVLTGDGFQNPLAPWLTAGGRLWLLGGGAASATQIGFELKRPGNVFSSIDGELVPGRFMYDFAHWRSEITVLRAAQFSRSDRAVGGYPGAPEYSRLPLLLSPKDPLTDALAPWRTTPSEFYQLNCYAEHLSMPNVVGAAQGQLDTLYETAGGDAGFSKPVMTVFHGERGQQIVFTGFPLWYIQRGQAIELIDFVLGQMWGLAKQ